MDNLLILILLIILFGWVFGLLFLIVPSALPIYIVYRLTKNSSEEEKFYLNMFSIAFFIPFIAFCLSLDLMLIILPMSFLIAIIIPSKKFKYKKFTLLTIILTAIISGYFIYLAPSIESHVVSKGLQEYQPIINDIEQYKTKNGNYPEKLKKEVISPKIYHYYKYTACNNRKAYKLEVSNSNYFLPSYIYCSNKNLDECSKKFKSIDFAYIKTGNWLKKISSD